MTALRCRFMWQAGALSRLSIACGLLLLAFVALWIVGVR